MTGSVNLPGEGAPTATPPASQNGLPARSLQHKIIKQIDGSGGQALSCVAMARSLVERNHGRLRYELFVVTPAGLAVKRQIDSADHEPSSASSRVNGPIFSCPPWAALSGVFKNCVSGVMAGNAADRAASTGAAAADE